MSTAFGISIVLLVVTWYSPRSGSALAILVAFLAGSTLLADLISCLDPPSRMSRYRTPPTRFLWGLVGFGVAGAMVALSRIALRREAAPPRAVAQPRRLA